MVDDDGKRGRRLQFARRPAALKVGLLAASVLVAILIGELGLRLHYLLSRRSATLADLAAEAPAPGSKVRLAQIVVRSPYPRLVYQLRPDLNVEFLGVRVRTNSAGWRDEEFPSADDRAVARILALGDSIVFGWGVEEHERFLDALEARLAAAHPRRRWQTLALAAPGYNLAMKVEALRRFGLETRPDLILYGYVEDDHCLPNFVVPQRSVLSLRSFLWFYAREGGAFSGLLRRTRVGSREADDLAFADRFCSPEAVPPGFREPVGPEAFARLLRELAAMAASRGIPVVFLDLSISPSVNERGRLPREFHYVDLFAARREFLARHGGGSYQESDLVLSAEDLHPSPAGHRLIAEVLSRYLVESGLARRMAS